MNFDIISKLHTMLQNELEHHPHARLIDLYKLYMQSAWGPGHLIEDADTAKTFLSKELSFCQQYLSMFNSYSKASYLANIKKEFKVFPVDIVIARNEAIQNSNHKSQHSFFNAKRKCYKAFPSDNETHHRRDELRLPTLNGDENIVSTISENDDRGNCYIGCPCLVLDCDAWYPFARYSLQLISDGTIPFDVFFDAFIKTANDEKMSSASSQESIYIDHWNATLPFLSERNIELYEYDLAIIKNMISEKQYMVRHSYTYNIKYKPAYRIINKDFLKKYDEIITERYFI